MYSQAAAGRQGSERVRTPKNNIVSLPVTSKHRPPSKAPDGWPVVKLKWIEAVSIAGLGGNAVMVAIRIMARVNQHTLRANPSIRRLEEETGCSRNTVRSAIRQLAEAGFLRVQTAKSGRHGDTNEFHPLWDRVNQSTPSADERGQIEADTGSIGERDGVNSQSGGGQSEHPEPVYEPVKREPVEKEPVDSARMRARPAVSSDVGSKFMALHPDWRDDFDYRMEASNVGLSADRIQRESDRFFDHYSGKDEKRRDWSGPWRNWCRNAVDKSKASSKSTADKPDHHGKGFF